MVIKNENRQVIIKPESVKNVGELEQKTIATSEDMYDKARLFTTVTIKQNCAMNYHVHSNETEIYVINSGKGIYNDNGDEVEVYPGDVTICKNMEGHGIRNESEEDLVYTALIIPM